MEFLCQCCLQVYIRLCKKKKEVIHLYHLALKLSPTCGLLKQFSIFLKALQWEFSTYQRI